MSKNEMKLGLFLSVPGHHVVAWRHPHVKKEDIVNFNFMKKQVVLAEKAKFDMAFLGDVIITNYNKPTFGQESVARFEPLTLLSGLAAVTEKIGLIGTVSTTYNEPYNVARKFSSLDHISNGRAGWNVVTSTGSEIANNFGGEEILHSTRYERAEEFLDVVKKLWDSWDEDALVFDQQNGQFLDPSKVHPIKHDGQFFKVSGPLNIPRSVQGHPVVVQAGSSEQGKELAARSAEVVFTAWQTVEEAQAFYEDVKSRLVKYGRDRDDLKIMPGIFPVVGRTEEEAQQKYQQLLDLIPEDLGVAHLSANLGVDLSAYPVDGPLPDLPNVEQINGIKSRFEIIKELSIRENLTIRQLYQRIAGARGHNEVVGTPQQIADVMQEWFENGAADGFNIMPAQYGSSLDDFVELVVPELQKRGIFKTEYTGDTLREHLGLKQPASLFALQSV